MKNQAQVRVARKTKAKAKLTTRRSAKAKKTTAKATKSKAKSKKSVQKEEERIANLILDHRENGRKLARSILRRWRVRMPADEIDSIVDLALCEAARRFSEDRGASFMTFYFYHLRGHLVRAVARAAQSSNVVLAFAQKNGLDPEEWSQLGQEALCNYAPDNVLFGQREIDTPENVILRKEKISECREAVTQLDDLEQEIINRSFGNEQALVDIAKTLGYSRCHISRVKKSALERLKGIIGNEDEAAEGSEDIAASSNDGLLERSQPAGRGRPKRRSRRRNIGAVMDAGLGEAASKAA